MDDNQISLGVEPEEISDSFICCVCLDLLYKPIVLSCGHVSCFWCVHRSMSSHRQSQCPLCRHQYIHFPTVCQMLHFLLLKKYPVAYKRRELQILEEEKQNGCFSPQLDAHGCSSQASQDLCILADSSCGESCANVKQVETISPIQNNGTAAPKGTHGGDYEGIGNVTDEEKNSLLNTDSGSGDQISVADVICAACKQLLFHPVVFNCGHVCCESCIVKPDERMLRCKVCQSSHPSGFPKVCLELGHFLEEQFPKEYALRRDAVQLKQADSKHGNPTACETKADAQGQKLSMSSWSDPSSEVHIGVGCDSCGMYPIVGDRYNCLDCFEEIGFDLCSYCYNTNSKLPGRFNQQHTPEHKFKLVRRGRIRNQLELVTGHLDASSLALIIASITSEGTISPDAQEDAENRSATHAPSTSSGDEQDESLTSD